MSSYSRKAGEVSDQVQKPGDNLFDDDERVHAMKPTTTPRRTLWVDLWEIAEILAMLAQAVVLVVAIILFGAFCVAVVLICMPLAMIAVFAQRRWQKWRPQNK